MCLSNSEIQACIFLQLLGFRVAPWKITTSIYSPVNVVEVMAETNTTLLNNYPLIRSKFLKI